MHKVFVYGTLKSGNTTRGLDQFGGATKVGDAITITAEYSLFDLGCFPGVTLDGCNRVQGEVWNVTDEVFKMLDRIEGYPDFYHRQEINTTAGKAWMYYLPHVDDFYGAKQIGYNQPEKTVQW